MIVLFVIITFGLSVISVCAICAVDASIAAELRGMDRRIEALRDDMDNWSEQQLNALWQRAQHEVDRQIAEARDRYR